MVQFTFFIDNKVILKYITLCRSYHSIVNGDNNTLCYTLNGHNIYNQEVTEYKESAVLAGQTIIKQYIPTSQCLKPLWRLVFILGQRIRTQKFYSQLHKANRLTNNICEGLSVASVPFEHLRAHTQTAIPSSSGPYNHPMPKLSH